MTIETKDLIERDQDPGVIRVAFASLITLLFPTGKLLPLCLFD